MPVFRFHRGSLSESMKTCIVVKNKHELWKHIYNFNKATGMLIQDTDHFVISSSAQPDEIIIKPYIFDERIGWNTHIVLIHSRCVTKDPYVAGFLSDALPDLEKENE